MRRYLGVVERAAYERRDPRAQRAWLLGRIAVKDAVRRWLWDHSAGPVFPAEIDVRNDQHGRPDVTGRHGRRLPRLHVSLAHCRDVAVAIARPATGDEPGVGIDVEHIADRGHAVSVALGPEEAALLDACCAATGEPAALWFTRFWAAKEAVSKAEGTGLGGRPRRFAVVAATPAELTVRVHPDGDSPIRTWRVGCAHLPDPAGSPEQGYVVAWTTGPTHNQEERQ